MKFIQPPCNAGGAHATSGLPGFPARDYMAKGGSLVNSPIKGKVSESRPFGKLATQNPSAGFGGSRMYLVEAGTGHEAYLAHFGTGANDLLVKPGDRVDYGTDLGRVWAWPNDPGRSHIHMGFQGGDPMYKLVDADGDIIKGGGPSPPSKPVYTMRKTGTPACIGKKSTEEGRWQVRKEQEGQKPKVLFQGNYAEAKDFLEGKKKQQAKK